jgi:uncharacterized phage protein gp47/JayE
MSFVAEPYLNVADQVLTALTGGVAREGHRFYARANEFSFAAGGDKVAPDSVRVMGQAAGAFFAFQPGRDFTISRDGKLSFVADVDNALIPAGGATWPDEGTEIYVGYYPVDTSDAVLTDRNVGSMTRTLGEAFARELAVLRKQLELVHRSAFVETAEGSALDMVVALLGVSRKARDYAQGGVSFFRDTPAPAEIFIPAGTRVSTALAFPAADGGPATPVSFTTIADRTLARGQLSVEAAVRAEERGPRGVVDAHAIALVDRTVLGIAGVVNDAPTLFGAAGESDGELRRRARTVAERAGRATPRALMNAIAALGEIRENDIKVVEELRLRPGVVQVFVAAPRELAVPVDEAIRSARAAGIRVEHNLQQYLTGPTLPLASSGEQRAEGTSGSTDDILTDGFSFPLLAEITVFCEDPRASGGEKQAIEQGVVDAIAGYVEAAEIGDTLVYNRISAAVMAVPGINDAVLDIAPAQPSPPANAPLVGKRNVRIPEGKRGVIDRVASIRVTFAGAPLSFDFQIKAKAKGLAGANTIRTDIHGRLATFFEAPLLAVTAGALSALLSPSDTHLPIDRADISWTAEYEQAGMIIRQEPGVTASTNVPVGSRAILRDVAVELVT